MRISPKNYSDGEVLQGVVCKLEKQGNWQHLKQRL